MSRAPKVALWGLVLLLGSETAPLVAQNAPQDNSAPVEPPASQFKLKKKRKKPADTSTDDSGATPEKATVSGTLGVMHGAAFGKDPVPVSSASLELSYKPSAEHTFYVALEARKYYEINGGEDEVDLADTPISYAYTFYKGENVSNALAFEATVATNKLSRDIGMIAEPKIGYKLGASFFQDIKLDLSLTPSAKYYVKEYKQTLDGTPLPRLQYGAKAGMTLDFHKVFTLIASGAYNILEYEKSRYTNSDDLTNDDLPNHLYVAKLIGSLPLSDTWSLNAGYAHSSTLDDYGSLEFILFEEEVTEWSVGVELNF